MSKTSKTIQEKIQQLDEMMEWFDGEDFVLEEALGKYEVAASLAEEIDKDLQDFRNTVTVLKKRFDNDEV